MTEAHQSCSAGSQSMTFQKRVVEWLMACFSMEVCRDGVERNHRFLEEALELVQSLGCTRSEAHQLVDYVFNRPVGEPHQELGGALVTLTALANCHDMDMMEAGETELARVWAKIDKIRAKQAAKPKHSPLPEHVPAPAQPAQVTDAMIAAAVDAAWPGPEAVYDDNFGSCEAMMRAAIEAALAAQPPAAPVKTATKSAPAPWGSQNTAERNPAVMSDVAGADTRLSAVSVADIDDGEMRELLSAKDVGKGRAILKRILKRLRAEPQTLPDHCTSDPSKCGKRSWPWCSTCPHAGFEPGVRS